MHYVRAREPCYMTKFIVPATNDEFEEDEEPFSPEDDAQPSTSFDGFEETKTSINH